MRNMKLSFFVYISVFLCATYITGCVTRDSFQYSQEIAWDGFNPILRRRLIARLNEKTIDHVSLTNMPTWEAMCWLSNQSSQSIGMFSNQQVDINALGSVNLTLTNATFFAVLDFMCQQNELYWGFKEDILLIYSFSFLNSTSGWVHLQDRSPHGDIPKTR